MLMDDLQCKREQETLTFRNVSSDPFSMYSVIIITGLPIDLEKEEEEKNAGSE